MYTILVVLQVLVAVALVGLILIQHGKGADAGAAFGSGASGTVFGARGSANFLSRATAALATVFFLVSLSLAYLVHGQKQATSVTETMGASAPPAVTTVKIPAGVPGQQAPAAAPAAPAAPAVPEPAPATPAPASAPAQPKVPE